MLRGQNLAYNGGVCKEGSKWLLYFTIFDSCLQCMKPRCIYGNEYLQKERDLKKERKIKGYKPFQQKEIITYLSTSEDGLFDDTKTINFPTLAGSGFINIFPGVLHLQ